jgi:hypothetical protein
MAADRVSGQVHALGRFAPTEAFGQVHELFPLARGEGRQRVIAGCLSLVSLVEE